MITKVEFVLQSHMTRTGPQLQFKCDEWIDEPLCDRPYRFRTERAAIHEESLQRARMNRGMLPIRELRVVKRTFIEETL